MRWFINDADGLVYAYEADQGDLIEANGPGFKEITETEALLLAKQISDREKPVLGE